MPNENDMMDKNAMLIEAYRIQVERWNKRRDIEWRLTLTLWSTILIITFAVAGKIELTLVKGLIIGIIYFFLFVVYWHWVRGLWIRNAQDKDWMYRYQEKINTEMLIDGTLEKGVIPRPCDCTKSCDYTKSCQCNFCVCNYIQVCKDWSACSQLLLTLVILVFSFLILCLSPKAEPFVLSVLKSLIRLFFGWG